MAFCFIFVFQLVLYLVLFLTNRYYFWSPLFAGTVYCTLLLLDCFDFAYVCMSLYSHIWEYMCIVHYFNYHFPDILTVIFLGFILVSLFWIFVITNLKPYESTSCIPVPGRVPALSLWSWSPDSKTLGNQITPYPREYQIVRTHTKEPT